MNKYLFICIIIIIPYSCKNDDKLELGETSLEKIFINIEYSLDKNYIVSTDSILDTIVINNITDDFKDFLFIPSKEINRKSLFKSDDIRLDELINNNQIFVAIPEYIIDGEILLSSDEWPIAFNKAIFRSDVIGDKIFRIAPKTRMILKGSYIYSNYKTSFKVNYFDQKLNKKEIIIGDWHGTKYKGSKIEILSIKSYSSNLSID